ncbi:MAG: alkaline phosphatase, partial [Dermatophilaceae bacterium]|nr:alkaline phosphatase [Dermatophilaceae bacterium]
MALVVLAGVAGAGVTTVNTASAADSNHGRINNVIYLLGDGMGRTHVTAARQRFYGADGLLNMETMPAAGQVATYSVERKSGQPGSTDFAPNYVTDSASA